MSKTGDPQNVFDEFFAYINSDNTVRWTIWLFPASTGLNLVTVDSFSWSWFGFYNQNIVPFSCPDDLPGDYYCYFFKLFHDEYGVYLARSVRIDMAPYRSWVQRNYFWTV